VEHVSAALAEAGQESFVASFDLDSTSVVVETFGPAVTDAETLSARAGLRNENAVNVRVTEVPREFAPEPAARGGMAYSSCTGGFIVKSGTTRYIATAHHCTTKPATYDGAATGPSVIASSYDVRRTYLSGSHGATFRRDVGVYSTATSYGNPAFGGYVCKFGTTTHLTCSVVDGTGQCVKYPDWPQFCGMFRTMSDIVDPGDSGGPAFNGGRALGLVSGHSPGVTSWFSQISTLSGLGVTVVTG
jgi:hypothetical protein